MTTIATITLWLSLPLAGGKENDRKRGGTDDADTTMTETMATMKTTRQRR